MPFHPVSFDCGLIIDNGADETELSWTMNGALLSNADGVQILNSGDRLILLKPKIEDAGIISCIARNQAGENHKDYKLDILGILNFRL